MFTESLFMEVLLTESLFMEVLFTGMWLWTVSRRCCCKQEEQLPGPVHGGTEPGCVPGVSG